MPFDLTPDDRPPRPDDPLILILARTLGRWPTDDDMIEFEAAIRRELEK
jgi:hypothetical protein